MKLRTIFSYLDGLWRVWAHAEQQRARSVDGHLPVPDDQDPAEVEWEAVHALSCKHQGNGQAHPLRLKQVRFY